MEAPVSIEQLISKFLSGEASPEEAIDLERWKNEHIDHLNHYFDCERIFTLNDPFYKELEDLDTEPVWQQLKDRIEGTASIKQLPVQNNNRKLLKIAASSVIIISLGLLLLFLFNKPTAQTTFYSSNEQSKTFKLPDGSGVTLLPNSNIDLNEKFVNGQRHLKLNGSAVFDVIHDEKNEFIIDAGNVFIKDIGTKFSVISSLRSDSISVKVNEGIVLLFDNINTKVEVKAPDSVVYLKSLQKIISFQQPESNQVLATFSFSDTRLEEVISTINEKFKTRVVLENNALKNCKITAQFKEENLQVILSIITETLNLGLEKTPEGYIIKGNSCLGK